MKILQNSGEPIYQQIASQFEADILAGKYEQGEYLPSIRGLAKELKISVITTMKHTRKGTRKETPTQGEGAIRKPGAGERPKTDSGPYKNKEI